MDLSDIRKKIDTIDFEILKLLNSRIAAFEENPDSVPDMILPVDLGTGGASATAFSMDDLLAVDYRGSTASVWSRYLYPGPSDPWPLWQPLSVRVMRRVVGERRDPAPVSLHGAAAARCLGIGWRRRRAAKE